MLLRGAVFCILFFIVSTLIGDFFLNIVQWKKSFAGAYVWGVLILFALFQIIAYPLYRIGTTFTLLLVTFSIVLLGILIAAVYYSWKSRSLSFYRNRSLLFLHTVLDHKGMSVLLCCVTLFFLFFCLGFYYSTSDDGQYVTRSLEAIAQNKLAFNERFAWYGWGNDTITDFKDCNTLSFFIACLSVLSGIHSTILNKTFLAFNLVMAHLSAISYVYDVFISDSEKHFTKKTLFFIFYCLFQLLCIKESSAGTWMTGYIWVGKAMLIAIVFPMLLATCGILYQRIDCFKSIEWLSVSIVLIAGICVSIVGIYLPVILYFTFGIAILIGTKFKYCARLWKPVLISSIPVVIFIICSYLGVIQGSSLANNAGLLSAGLEETSRNTESIFNIKEFVRLSLSSWIVQFWQANDFWQLVLYCLGVIWFLIKGSKIQKTLFVLAPVILLLTFLNPFLINPVSKYITTSIVYWRLFWLLPIYIIPAIAFSEILDILFQGHIEKCLIGIALSLFILAGFEIFRYSVTSAEYSIIPFATNIGKLFNVRPELRFGLYNLNPGPLETAKIIEADWDQEGRPMVLMCFSRPFELRMYSPEIALVAPARDYQNAGSLIEGTEIRKGDFFTTFEKITDGEYLKELLSRLDVDYVCFSQQPIISNLEDYSLDYVGSVYGSQIWKVLN